MRIVLDTNCLLPAVFSKSMYHWVWEAFINGDFTLCYSNEMLTEYEELLSRLYPPAIAKSAMFLLMKSPNTERIIPFFQWNLINVDPDDNKFVDCALNAGADLIVTNDHHFDVLKSLPFPKIEVVDIETFKNILQKYPSPH
jgi:putative PIN family toxin of toxin-antitoxin system